MNKHNSSVLTLGITLNCLVWTYAYYNSVLLSYFVVLGAICLVASAYLIYQAIKTHNFALLGKSEEFTMAVEFITVYALMGSVPAFIIFALRTALHKFDEEHTYANF